MTDLPSHSTGQLMGQISAQLQSQLRGIAPRVRGHRAARPALVAVAHGSRHPAALRAVRALVERVQVRRPDLPVHLAHIELNQPLLGNVLAGLRGEAVLVPLLFTRGHHVTHDLPAALAASGLRGRVAAPLGPHPLLAAALHARLTEAGWRRGAGVVLASAGSRRAASTADTERTAALLGERLGVRVIPGYTSAASPTVAEAVRSLRSARAGRVAVASCFAAPGLFADRAREASPWIASAPLGPHPDLVRLVLERYAEALTAVELPDPAVPPFPGGPESRLRRDGLARVQ